MVEPHDPPDSTAGHAVEELLAWLLECEVEVEVILGEKTVPIEDLVRAREGHDLFLLSRDQPLRLVADGVEIGTGTAVEHQGRLGICIGHLRPIDEVAAELGGKLRDRDSSSPS